MVAKKEEELPDPWVDPKEVVVDRDRLTITLKAGGGYDAPWLVYHASTVEEGIDFLIHDRYDELADLTARKGKELAKAFGGSTGFSKPAGSTSTGFSKPASSSEPAEPAGAVEWDPEAEEYACAHGGATQRKGESAKGPWTGYFCPEPKGSPNQCAPKFLNKKR